MKKIFIYLSVILVIFASSNSWAASTMDMDPIVVTASRMAQHDYKVAGNVTVISQKQIEESHAQNIPDVLQQVLGAFVYDRNTTKTSVLDMRGFGDTAMSNVLVLVNERRINSADISGPDLLQIPIEAVERIEVIRGAGSVLYGDNAVGGVVNIITKEGKGDFSGRVGSSYGSYDAQGEDMEVGGKWKNISYFMYSKYADDRGYRQNSDVLAKDFNGRLGYKFAEKMSAGLDFGWHEDNYHMPGGINASQITDTSRRESDSPSDVAHTKDRFMKLSFDVTPWPEDVYLGKLVFDLHARKRDVSDSFAGFDTNRDARTFGLTPKYIFDHQVFDRDVNFVTGIDYYDTQSDILGSGSNTDDLTISKNDFGVYGLLEAEIFPKLFANGGTRYYKADYAFSQRNVARDEKKHPDEWVSMGGLKYEYGNGSTVHANAQQTFRSLATDEWYSTYSGLNTDLQQQTGIQYEAGVKHNFGNGAIVSVTPYWMINDNEIFFDPTSGFFGSNSNYDKTKRFGVEIGSNADANRFLELSFLDKLDVFTNYTYQDARFGKGSSDGKYVPMTPHHEVASGVMAQFGKYYHAGLIGRYTGTRFAINDTLNEAPRSKPYYVTDVKLSYKRDSLELYANINNIFNKLYSPYAVKAGGTIDRDEYPAPETNFTVGANVKF